GVFPIPGWPPGNRSTLLLRYRLPTAPPSRSVARPSRWTPDPGTPGRPRMRAGLVQRLDQTLADRRVVAGAVVGLDVGAPHPAESSRLGPQAQDFVIVILQRDAAAGLYRAPHRPHYRERVGRCSSRNRVWATSKEPHS